MCRSEDLTALFGSKICQDLEYKDTNIEDTKHDGVLTGKNYLPGHRKYFLVAEIVLSACGASEVAIGNHGSCLSKKNFS